MTNLQAAANHARYIVWPFTLCHSGSKHLTWRLQTLNIEAALCNLVIVNSRQVALQPDGSCVRPPTGRHRPRHAPTALCSENDAVDHHQHLKQRSAQCTSIFLLMLMAPLPWALQFHTSHITDSPTACPAATSAALCFSGLPSYSYAHREIKHAGTLRENHVANTLASGSSTVACCHLKRRKPTPPPSRTGLGQQQAPATLQQAQPPAAWALLQQQQPLQLVRLLDPWPPPALQVLLLHQVSLPAHQLPALVCPLPQGQGMPRCY